MLGATLEGTQFVFDPLPGKDPTSPLMVVRASKRVIDGHSGMYTGPFFEFLVSMVTRVQINELRNKVGVFIR